MVEPVELVERRALDPDLLTFAITLASSHLDRFQGPYLALLFTHRKTLLNTESDLTELPFLQSALFWKWMFGI